MVDADRAALVGVLEEARSVGLLGPGPVAPQVEHAAALGRAIGEFQGRMLDLGSGGGLPGLVLFDCWPMASGVLLDAQRRRCDFLTRADATHGFEGRVEVRCGRAEALARAEGLRSRFDLVVARSFARPAVTAECAVGFLRSGGILVVTEPPESPISERWPSSGLAELGLAERTELRVGETRAVRLRLPEATSDRWPRRDGVPAKRPLW